MTVQDTSGLPVLVQGKDFIRTDRGITWGIKCRTIPVGQYVAVCTLQSNGTWNWDELPEGMLESGFDTSTGYMNYASIMEWFTNKLLPKLNKWLAKKFPATNALPPPPAALTPLEQADQLIQVRLKINVDPIDGTLVATLQ
jgi:hypothetical protein